MKVMTQLKRFIQFLKIVYNEVHKLIGNYEEKNSIMP